MKTQFHGATQVIRDWLVQEHFPAGTRLPSRKTLVAQFQLSPALVLRACQTLVSAGLLYRDGYKLIVRSTAQAVPMVTGTIYVLSYYDKFSHAVARILTERGISHRIVELSWTRHRHLAPVLRKIFAQKAAGIILWGTELREDTKFLLKSSGLPITICADGMDEVSLSSVQTDFYRGAEKAVRHLYELGHRHIAHISEGDRPAQRASVNYFRAACLKLNLVKSASLVWQAENWHEEIMGDIMLEGRRRHPEVTAIFCGDLAGVVATQLFRVPDELSVVSSGGFTAGLETRPPLTTVALRDPEETVALWACTDLISQIQTLAAGRPARPPKHTFLVPDLILRASTQALSTSKIAAKASHEARASEEHVPDTWRKVYPFIQKSGSDQWHQLDISGPANHSMTKQHGWLGQESLEHFPPGLRSIHGVPFQVLDENKNGGRAVITFRSPHSHSAGKEKLPTRASIRVGRQAKALYFLHGCGYAKPIAFAEYVMHYRAGEPFRVALIPLGSSRRLAAENLGRLQPNMQDWWPDFERPNFPHAHCVTIFDPTNPAVYERSLYSLEWINPRPGDEITSVEVRVDPSAGPTLALVAITALL